MQRSLREVQDYNIFGHITLSTVFHNGPLIFRVVIMTIKTFVQNKACDVHLVKYGVLDNVSQLFRHDRHPKIRGHQNVTSELE